MVRAGQLRERIAFDKRRETDDGAGNLEGAFEEQFVVWAEVLRLRGGEGVIAARLEGKQPVVITVRQSAATRLIKADWRARDKRTGEEFALVSPPAEPKGQRGIFEILGTAGVAA